MTAVYITSFYAAVLALLFVALAVRVIRQRHASRIALGVAGNSVLERLARVHANFAEYVPFTLMLLLLAELAATPRWMLHVAGIALVAGRLTHAIGVSRAPEDFRLRTFGMAATLGTIVTLALILFWRVAIVL